MPPGATGKAVRWPSGVFLLTQELRSHCFLWSKQPFLGCAFLLIRKACPRGFVPFLPVVIGHCGSPRQRHWQNGQAVLAPVLDTSPSALATALLCTCPLGSEHWGPVCVNKVLKVANFFHFSSSLNCSMRMLWRREAFLVDSLTDLGAGSLILSRLNYLWRKQHNISAIPRLGKLFLRKIEFFKMTHFAVP